MDTGRLCMFCMEDNGGQDVCPHCGRDANADTAFITMVLELEQAKLEARAGAAKLIISKSCEVLSYEPFQAQMNAGR